MGAACIEERIEWLWRLSRTHSCEFQSPEAVMSRKRYLAEHPTHIIVLKCMDGRIHIPYATKTPLGIIEPFRNLGGMFDLGWPYLGEVIADSVNAAADKGKRTLIVITYHFSRGDVRRGCAGFGYDRDASIRYVERIKRQVEAVFGQGRQTVYPVVLGFETDEDALILHGEGETWNLAGESDDSEAYLALRISRLYPDMPEIVARDLLPLARGNIRHIRETRSSRRELASEHREWMICVGRGYDFLHEPNIALIIGPYSPDLSSPIARAAGIIAANMESGRIPDDGFLLLASAPYRETGTDKARALLKSRFLSEFADEVIRREHPALYPRMIRKTAILNWSTRELRLLEDVPQDQLY